MPPPPLGDDPVVDLVMRCVTGLVLDEMNLWDNRVGAPQGLALSPLLSNLYMVPFDSEMRMVGLNLVRYADDFVVLSATREEADQAERTARNLLAKLRLRPLAPRVGRRRSGQTQPDLRSASGVLPPYHPGLARLL